MEIEIQELVVLYRGQRLPKSEYNINRESGEILFKRFLQRRFIKVGYEIIHKEKEDV